MAQKATCPRCSKETEWIATVRETFDGQEIDRFQALCDGCQADQAVEAAYAGTDY
jgi:hypothetical protein